MNDIKHVKLLHLKHQNSDMFRSFLVSHQYLYKTQIINR